MKTFIAIFLLANALTQNAYSQQTKNADSSKVNSDSLLLEKVEVEASFGDGKNTWSKFLDKNINYDIASFNDAPRGIYKVKVRFVIFTDGRLGNIETLTKYGYGMEREVVHALKKSPRWTPASQNGRSVNAYRTQTISFIVE